MDKKWVVKIIISGGFIEKQLYGNISYVCSGICLMKDTDCYLCLRKFHYALAN